jgi:hypothetical protein
LTVAIGVQAAFAADQNPDPKKMIAARRHAGIDMIAPCQRFDATAMVAPSIKGV